MVSEAGELFALEPDTALHSGVAGEQSQYGERSQGLARTGLADQRQHLSAFNPECGIPHRDGFMAGVRKTDPEIPDFKDGHISHG